MNLIKKIESGEIVWIDILKPNEETLDFLKKIYYFHPFLLKNILPPLRHPRFENYGEYFFIVFHYPFFNQKSGTIEPREVDIIVGKEFLITLHYQNILPLRRLFIKSCLYPKEKEKWTKEGTGKILYLILTEMQKEILPRLDRIDKKIDQIEKIVFSGEHKKALEKIEKTKKNLIQLERIIHPQLPLFKSLKDESARFFGREFYPLFNEIFNLFLNVKEIIETHHQTLNELEETNSNLLNIRTNEIMKFLTIIATIGLPLSLIFSFFGMNFHFEVSLKEVFFLSFLSIGTFLLFLKIKKWI